MGTGAITEYVDVAQIALYAFWILFFILVGYLHREGKREGWPLQMSSGELRTGVGGMPPPKTYRLAHGQGERVKPGPEPAQYEVNATQIYDASGAPFRQLRRDWRCFLGVQSVTSSQVGPMRAY